VRHRRRSPNYAGSDSLLTGGIRELIAASIGDDAKKRKFTETIELQIGLKNYDPQVCAL